MSPHRRLSTVSRRQPSQIQDIFLGLAFQLADGPSAAERDLEYTAVLHDATGVVESETFHMQVKLGGDDKEMVEKEAWRVSQEVLELLQKIEKEKSMNVGLDSCPLPPPPWVLSSVVADAWQRMCIVAGPSLSIAEHQIRLVAVADTFPEELRAAKGAEFFAKVWLHIDAIP